MSPFPMRRVPRIFPFAVPIVAMLVTLSGCSSKPASVQLEEPIRTVEVAAVTRGVLDEGLTLSGKVKGQVEVAVLPKAAGRVEKVAVQVGKRVRPGDLLIQLETKDVMAQIAQAEAAVKAAEAGKENAQAQATLQILSAEQNVKQAQEAVRQAEKALAAAQNSYDLAAKNLQRQKSLFEAGVASQTAVEQAENGFKQAEAGLQQAKSGYETARKALQVAQENLRIANERIALKAADAQVEQAKAALVAARRQLENMSVTAPVAGVVASLPVKVGEMVNPQSVVATIVNMNPAIVEVDLPEHAYGSVAVGDPVKVTIQEKTYQGKVTSKDLTPNSQTKAYLVKIEVPNPEGRIASGLSATVTFLPKGAKPTILIPAEAYMASEKAGEGRVMVYKDGVVHERRITVGRQTSKYVEVTSGLQPGENVVVKGQYLVKDGDRVRLPEDGQQEGGRKS